MIRFWIFIEVTAVERLEITLNGEDLGLVFLAETVLINIELKLSCFFLNSLIYLLKHHFEL